MKKFENFKSALLNLKDIYSCQEPYSNVEIAGMVGLYEICFEQAWKAMKEILQNSGYAEGATGSPRTILKTSEKKYGYGGYKTKTEYQKAYNEAIAMDIIRQTKDKYYEMFVQLEQTIEKDWM